ncbi:MAG: HEPN domain-containing protein [Candidatus Methanoperedens sp.]|nr:HEPN domain-containing protein [Candidatus Methanoperedens sp.]
MKNFNVLDYIHEAEELEKLSSEFINLCEEYQMSGYGTFLKLTTQAKSIQRELLRRYEVWFAVTKLVVKQYSDKNSEFEDNYVILKNYITLKNTKSSKSSYLNNLVDSFDTQVNILHTIIPTISLKETNFKKILTADLLDSELSQAELLYKHEFYRAAGAIAGVVLERYLKTLCEVNQITIGENDTIEPLATKIYKSEKIPEFDITLFKSIQHLASIRNKCDHPKEEPKQHEVRELLDKVKKITFWRFKN